MSGTSNKEKLNRAYLESKVNRILEPLVVDIVSNKPDNPVSLSNLDLIHDWLAQRKLWRPSICSC